MHKPIRLVHFADVHVGMENYGRLDTDSGTSTRVRDFLDRIDEVIQYACDNDADIAVFAGDAFKTRDPNPTYQREFAIRMKKLADKMPLLLLVGNHDVPGMASRASSVDIFDALNVPNVTVGDGSGGKVIETTNGPLFLGWLAYQMRNRLLVKDEYKDKSVNDLDMALLNKVGDIIGDLSDQAKRYDTIPRVFCTHLSVSEAKLGSERSVMLGKDITIDKSLFDQDVWDYIALGHIHKHQDVNKGSYPAVVYSGSLERIDFGEEKEPKGFCWVELQRSSTSWEFVSVNARPFLTIRVDVRGDSDPTESILKKIASKDISGVVVRLVLQIKTHDLQKIKDKEIANALSDAHSYSIVKDVDHEARTRIGGVAAETLSSEELLERYFIDKGYDSDTIKLLMNIANDIILADQD